MNGFSTSLPEEVQVAALRKIPGLERVHVLRPGYAIEYDYFPPYQIRYSLETKYVEGLFFAGQINGTTGYEEAAAQAHGRDQRGAEAPGRRAGRVATFRGLYRGVDRRSGGEGDGRAYRMFTSRAEHRILLRQDNADLRLTELGYRLGLATRERYERLLKKKEAIARTRRALEETTVRPEQVNGYLERWALRRSIG